MVRVLQGVRDRRLGGGQGAHHGVERPSAGVDQGRGLRGAAPQPADPRRVARHGRAVARPALVGLAQVARDLLGGLHGGARAAEAVLLARLRRQGAEFLGRVAQIVGVGPDLGDARLLGLQLAQQGAAALVGRPDLAHEVLQAPERVDQSPVRRGIDQGAVVVLPVDLHERAGQPAQHLRADRHVVHEGAGPAVRHLHAPKDEVALDLDVHAERVALGADVERPARTLADQLGG